MASQCDVVAWLCVCLSLSVSLSERMQIGCSLVLRRPLFLNLNFLASGGYVTQLPSPTPQLLRLLAATAKSNLSRQGQISSSSSSYSSGTTGSSTPQVKKGNISMHDAMDSDSSNLQEILPALQNVVPVLAPGRHKGQAGKFLFQVFSVIHHLLCARNI